MSILSCKSISCGCMFWWFFFLAMDHLVSLSPKTLWNRPPLPSVLKITLFYTYIVLQCNWVWFVKLDQNGNHGICLKNWTRNQILASIFCEIKTRTRNALNYFLELEPEVLHNSQEPPKTGENPPKLYYTMINFASYFCVEHQDNKG